MNTVVPYNSTETGKAFVGHREIREDVLRGLLNGGSYAILGGRRCGKSSMLKQLGRELKDPGLEHFCALPRYLTVQ